MKDVAESASIQPDADLLWAGYEVAMHVIGSNAHRITVTREEQEAVTYFMACGMSYCEAIPPDDMFRWRGKRYEDGSRDIVGKQLAAMRDYWRANLYTILVRGIGSNNHAGA